MTSKPAWDYMTTTRPNKGCTGKGREEERKGGREGGKEEEREGRREGGTERGKKG